MVGSGTYARNRRDLSGFLLDGRVVEEWPQLLKQGLQVSELFAMGAPAGTHSSAYTATSAYPTHCP
jgi:hypothetical protein